MKNAITRLTIILFILGATLSVFGAQLDVQTFVDGRSDLVIQDLPPSITCPGTVYFFCGPSGGGTVHVSDPDSDTLTLTGSGQHGLNGGLGLLGPDGISAQGESATLTVTGTQGAGVDLTFWVDFANDRGPWGGINWRVSDGQNTDFCFTWIGRWDTSPSIQCPADITVQADPGQTSAIVNYPPPTVSSPCRPGPDPDLSWSLVTCDPPSGSTFPIGTTTVLCTVTDSSTWGHYSPWNSANCIFNVTVASFDPCANDSQAPQVSCLALKPSRLFPNPTRIVAQVQLLATDDCDSDPLIYVGGTKTAFVAGPFHNGDIVEVAHGPSLTPGSHPGGPPNVAAIQLIGDVQIWAVDCSGNASAKQICR